MFEQAFKNIDDVLHKDAGVDIVHRSPAEMMKEIAALDQESAELMERCCRTRCFQDICDYQRSKLKQLNYGKHIRRYTKPVGARCIKE